MQLRKKHARVFDEPPLHWCCMKLEVIFCLHWPWQVSIVLFVMRTSYKDESRIISLSTRATKYSSISVVTCVCAHAIARICSTVDRTWTATATVSDASTGNIKNLIFIYPLECVCVCVRCVDSILSTLSDRQSVGCLFRIQRHCAKVVVAVCTIIESNDINVRTADKRWTCHINIQKTK